MIMTQNYFIDQIHPFVQESQYNRVGIRWWRKSFMKNVLWVVYACTVVDGEFWNREELDTTRKRLDIPWKYFFEDSVCPLRLTICFKMVRIWNLQSCSKQLEHRLLKVGREWRILIRNQFTGISMDSKHRVIKNTGATFACKTLGSRIKIDCLTERLTNTRMPVFLWAPSENSETNSIERTASTLQGHTEDDMALGMKR